MKKIAIILLALSINISFVNAQEYQQAIGLRAGFFNGITYKQFVKSDAAFEIIGYTRWRGIEVVGLYEWHKFGVFEVPRLNFYYGGGAHVGLYDNFYYPRTKMSGSTLNIGVDGILGLEYNIQDIPLNISIDWKPFVNIIGYRSFGPDGGAISIRYLIK